MLIKFCPKTSRMRPPTNNSMAAKSKHLNISCVTSPKWFPSFNHKLYGTRYVYYPTDPSSELELMRVLVFRQAPAWSKVLAKFRCLLHSSNNCFINHPLVSCLGSWERLLRLGLSILKEFLLRRTYTLHCNPAKVGIIDFLINLLRSFQPSTTSSRPSTYRQPFRFNLSWSCNDIGLVDPSKGHTVDLVRTSH